MEHHCLVAAEYTPFWLLIMLALCMWMSCIDSMFLNFRYPVICDVTLYHWVFLHVSKDHNILLLGLLDPKDEGIMTSPNTKRHSPNDRSLIREDLNPQQHQCENSNLSFLKCQKYFHFVYNKRQYISSWPHRCFIHNCR
jgi:hypothetical protein